jgi:hypothetical protein
MSGKSEQEKRDTMNELEDLIAQAIADPNSVVGKRRGPGWGKGDDGYAEEYETVPRWSTRAVLAVLDQRQLTALPAPEPGRMAAYLPGGPGEDPAAVFHLEGWHSIFRFTVNLLHQQVDIAAGARPVLVEMREHMTPARFDPMARQILGDDRYNQLRDWFERCWSCRGCGKDIRVGWKYAPTSDGGAVCAACCQGHPDYVARLVKRPPAATLATVRKVIDVELPAEAGS